MNEDFFDLLNQKLCGIRTLTELYGCSTSTILRKIKSGEISAPDIPGGDGRPNKWFASKIKSDFEKYCKKEGDK